MNAMKCEMCGSTDFVKVDGMFVCQFCGVKYSPEDAKKMMIEGTVDVSGSTVKVDQSGFVAKQLANARRAYEKQDWIEVEKYYNMVEQHEPTNIEAIFYSSYAKARQTLVEADYYKKEAAFGVLRRCVSIVDDNYTFDDKDIATQISKDILTLLNVQYVCNRTKNDYGITVNNDSYKTEALFKTISAEFYTTCFNIANKYPLTELENRKYFYEMALTHAEAAKLGPTNIENAKAAVAHPEGAYEQAYEQAKKNMAADRKKAKARDSVAVFVTIAFGMLVALIVLSMFSQWPFYY